MSEEIPEEIRERGTEAVVDLLDATKAPLVALDNFTDIIVLGGGDTLADLADKISGDFEESITFIADDVDDASESLANLLSTIIRRGAEDLKTTAEDIDYLTDEFAEDIKEFNRKNREMIEINEGE